MIPVDIPTYNMANSSTPSSYDRSAAAVRYERSIFENPSTFEIRWSLSPKRSLRDWQLQSRNVAHAARSNVSFASSRCVHHLAPLKEFNRSFVTLTDARSLVDSRLQGTVLAFLPYRARQCRRVRHRTLCPLERVCMAICASRTKSR